MEMPGSLANRFAGRRAIPIIFWFLVFVTVVIMAMVDSAGWDLRIYRQAAEWLRSGHDPYAEGIAIQHVFQNQLALHPHARRPMTYVYPPLTFPLLRLAGAMPPWLCAGLYWLAYAAAAITIVWAGMQLPEKAERAAFAFLAPAASFFPGLLQEDVLLSGNVAYILYGLVFGAAFLGWRRGQWRWFYLAVLAASCCKAPLLSLVAIPVFSARKQWLPAGVTAVAGATLFSAQAWLWPSAFRNYLEAVELQFRYNRDFGFSPAGLLGRALRDAGHPYAQASTALYLLYALVVLALLFYLARRFFDGKLTLERWIPVLLIGVFLLNPRIKEYDVAALTLPMALVAWRVLGAITASVRRAVVLGSILFLAANCISINSEGWKYTEMILLLGLFVGGCWQLLRQARPAMDGQANQRAFQMSASGG